MGGEDAGGGIVLRLVWWVSWFEIGWYDGLCGQFGALDGRREREGKGRETNVFVGRVGGGLVLLRDGGAIC